MKGNEQPEPRFAVCIRNDGYPASLELRKVYRIIPDDDAARDGFLRVVDEWREDYLFPAAYFLAM